MRIYSFLIVALLFWPIQTHAQNKVGSSVVDGKTIDLFSDFTWQYRTGIEDAACTTVSPGIEFCGTNRGWQKSNDSSSDITAQFRFDDRTYGLFIVEDIGASDGVSLEYMRNIVVENMAIAADVSKENILILEVEDGTFHGKPSSMIVYSGKVEGLKIVFANTIVIEPSRSLQLATYSFGDSFTEKHRRVHDDFLSMVKFNQ
jgi:hypothetical protein